MQSLEDEKIKKFKKEYKAYAKKLPMMIKTSGLGAALAFITSKNSKPYAELFSNIENWLKNDTKKLLPEGEKLMGYVLKQESLEYRIITIEVLAYLNWLRRFAEGVIEGEE